MAFNSQPPRVEYSANAGQTIFTFLFKIYTDTNIVAYRTPSGEDSNDIADKLILGVDYSVSINGDNGGALILTIPSSQDDSITILRQLPVIRDVEYQTSGDLLAQTLNEDQNYQTYLTLDAESSASKHLVLSESSQGVSNQFPNPSPDMFIRWNPAGTKLINSAGAESFPEAETLVLTATAGQTVFSFPDSDVTKANIYLNGVLLVRDEDYTDTLNDTTSITLAEASELDDKVSASGIGKEVSGSGTIAIVAIISELADIDTNLITTAIVQENPRGGTFNYDASLVAQNDGGVVFDGWVRQHSQEVMVSWYGVVSGSTSDSLAEIQKALDYTVANELNLVIDGQYSLQSKLINTSIKRLTIKGINNAKLTALSGFPNDTMVDLLASADATTSNRRKLVIRDISFNGENIPNSGVGEANDILTITGNGSLNLESVEVTNCDFRAGDRFETAGSDTCLMIGGINRVVVSECYFIGAPDAGIYITGAGTVSGVDYTLEAGHDCSIFNNKFRYCATGAIIKREFRKTTISNNYIRNCESGIAQGRGDAHQQSGEKLIISNNNISKCTTSIFLRQQEGAVVSGNLIGDMGYLPLSGVFSSSVYGMQIEGSQACSVSGNSFRGHNENIAIGDIADFTCFLLEKRVEDAITWDCAWNNIVGNTCDLVDVFAIGVNGEVETHDNRFTGNSIGRKADGSDMASPFINLSTTNTYSNIYTNGTIQMNSVGGVFVNGSPITAGAWNGISARNVAVTTNSVTGTTETAILTFNYTLVGDNKKIIFEPSIKCSMTTHDKVTIANYIDAVLINTSVESDSSSDNTVIEFASTYGALSTATYASGTVVAIEVRVTLDVGTGITFGNNVLLKITEID